MSSVSINSFSRSFPSPFVDLSVSDPELFSRIAFASLTKADFNPDSATEGDLQKAQNFKPRRAQEYLFGRFAAREALSRLKQGSELGAPAELGRGDDGETLWPQGVVGAITHTKLLAASAVALDTDVLALGIDVEQESDRAARVLKRIAVTDELRWVNSQPTERELNAMLLFSTKESIYKALFPLCHRYFGFHAVKLSAPSFSKNRDSGRLEAELLVGLGPSLKRGFVFGASFSRFDGFLMTGVCIKQTPSC